MLNVRIIKHVWKSENIVSTMMEMSQSLITRLSSKSEKANDEIGIAVYV